MPGWCLGAHDANLDRLHLQAYYDCVQRCLVAVDTKLPCSLPVNGQPTYYEDFSFHDEVITMVAITFAEIHYNDLFE